uniref:Uncharacterized protein n=1 Tax=Photinus pyralis TaxID=7054 RepID=A0A1Y1NML7_PHOPY
MIALGFATRFGAYNVQRRSLIHRDQAALNLSISGMNSCSLAQCVWVLRHPVLKHTFQASCPKPLSESRFPEPQQPSPCRQAVCSPGHPGCGYFLCKGRRRDSLVAGTVPVEP